MENTVSERMLAWYDENKRTLPFRGNRDPYRVWVSEIMLQQTRTETVSSYFTRFIARFPDVFSLAEAREEEVLKLWEGLGYYSRARNLHKAAKKIVSEYGGVFPGDPASLRALPGVGDYTAAAVASIAFDVPVPAMDGNLTRVFSRLFGVRDDVGAPSVKRRLFFLAQGIMPAARCGDLNQSLMDLGATVCLPGTPECEKCPLWDLCDAYAQGDADMLPIKSAAAAPREVRLAVVIVTSRGRVLMMKREEKLLKDLWVFPLLEDALPGEGIEKELNKLGVRAHFEAELGPARHVFTHRVWNMTLYHYAAEKPESRQGQWLTLREMQDKPLPTAVRAAKIAAERLLRPEFSLINEENLPSLSAAYAQSWQGSHKDHCSPAILAQHTPEYMEMLLRGHRDCGRKVLCLSVAGETAGVMVLDEEENELMSLYIAPDFQDMGLGKQCVAHAVSALDQQKCMRVTAIRDNERAVHLYRSFGFTLVQAERILDKTRDLRELVLLRPPKKD